MSTTARYVLWSHGDRLAQYQTLGQALLGAVWRSRKLQASVYIFKRSKTGATRYLARVNGT